MIVFSIIIPTCNRNDQLALCLERLKPGAQSFDANQYEVIVTDDGKMNEAKTLVETAYPWVKWVAGPKRGPAANRNNGAGLAAGEWLVFTDDDCLPDKDFLQGFMKGKKKNKNILVFEGTTLPDRERLSLTEEAPINTNGGVLWSCNFMIDKKYFLNQLKGFDEDFPYAAMEDVELRHRIVKDKHEIIFLEDAIVVHPWRQPNNVFDLSKKRFQSTLYFLKKHPEKVKEINFIYYVRAFVNGLFFDTLKNMFRYKGKGLYHKLYNDFKQLHYAFKILSVTSFYHDKKNKAKNAS